MGISPLAATTGVVTGINWNNIINEMISVESQPLVALEGQKSVASQEQQVYTSLQGNLSSLQSAALALSQIGGQALDTVVGTSSDNSVATVSASAGALPASAALDVLALATPASGSSSATAYNGSATAATSPQDTSTSNFEQSPSTFSPTSSLSSQSLAAPLASSGSLTLNGVAIAWNSSQSLNDILGLINSSSAGVTATYNSSAGTVTLTGSGTGSSASLSVGESSGNLLEALNLTAGTTTGANATGFDPTATLASQASFLNTPVTAGTFTINGVTFEVNPTTQSLNEVLQAVNSSSAGVQAYFDQAAGTISMRSTADGSTAQLSLGASGDSSNLLAAFNLSNSGVTAGADAQVQVNGGATQNIDGNTSTSLLPGGTVSFTGTGVATIGVGASASDAATAVQTFVSAYNSAVSAIYGYLDQTPQQTAPLTGTPTTQQANANPSIQGDFIGNPLLQQTLDQLVNLVATVSAPGQALSQLSQAGLTLTSSNGGQQPPTLNFNQTTFESAFQTDPASVNKLISDPSTGLGQTAYNALQGLINPTTGSFTAQINGLTADQNSLSQQISAMQANLLYQQKSLQTEYAQLEATLGTMQQQGQQIQGTLTTLAAAAP